MFYLKALEVLPANVLRRQLQGPQTHVCVPKVQQRALMDRPARGHPMVALNVRASCQHDSHHLLAGGYPGPMSMSTLLSAIRARSAGPGTVLC